MNHSWTYVTLRDACQIKPPKKEASERLAQTDLVSFVPMNDLGIREKHLVPVEDKPFQKVSGSYTYFANGDVLLAKITPCFENGKLGIARGLKNGVGFGSSEFIVFRPKDYLDPEFLFYYLSQDSFQDAGKKVMSGAVGHKRVPKEFIQNHVIPLPPLSEQNRIVTILDETFSGIDAAISNTEKNLDNARELFESYLNSAFSDFDKEWKREHFGDLAEFKNGVNYTKNSKGERVRIVGVQEFKSDYWVPIEELEAVQLDGKLSEAYELRKDDILIVRSNGNKDLIGRCLLAGPVKHKTTHSGFTIRARLTTSDLLPEYLAYYLKSYQSRQSLTQVGGGANISSLNQKGLASLSICFPRKDEQRVIVSRIVDAEDSMQKLESIYQQKLNALNELKQSVLHKAFSGELTREAVEEALDEAVA